MAVRLAMPQQQQGEPGGISGLLRNAASGIRLGVGQGFELARPIARTFNLADEETIRSVKNPFLSQSEIANPLKTTARSLAGIGSYAVPFGGGANLATRALLPGAAAGGLGSFSQAENATAGEVAGGALTGGLTAGVLDKLLRGGIGGKAAKGLEEAGSKVRSGVSPIKVKAGVGGAATEREIQKALDTVGIRGNAAQKYEQLLPKVQEVGDDIERLMMSPSKTGGTMGDKPVKLNTILGDFDKNLKSTIRSSELSKKQVRQEVNSYVSQLMGDAGLNQGETIALRDLFGIKRMVNEDYGGVAQKLANGVPLSTKEKIISVARGTFDDVISATSPELKELTKLQSNLYAAAPSLESARRISEPSFRIPFAGNQVPIPGGRAGQDRLGALLQSAGQRLGGVEGAVSPALASQLTQGGVRLATGQPREMAPAQPESLTSLTSLGAPGTAGPAPTAQLGGADPESLRQLLQIGVATGEISPSQVSALEALGAIPAKQTAAADKAQRSLNSAVPSVTRIAQSALSAPSGFGATLQAAAGRIPGVEGGAAEELAADTDSLATQIAKAFAGESGVASDKDIKRWKGLLPQPGDTLNERKKKLQKLSIQIIDSSEANGLEVPPEIYSLLSATQ